MADYHTLSNFIWQIAELLRGPYRAPQYERVMLPMTVLRRFDCVLAPTKTKVLAEYEKRKAKYKGKETVLDPVLNKAAGQRFHNHSRLTFEALKADPNHIQQHLASYIKGFSQNVRVIFERFEFEKEIEKMHEADILYLVVSRFCDVDLHPKTVDNIEMGLLFEDLIRRFNESANETAGDYFTPRDVIRLMVDILFDPDDELLTKPGAIRKLLDPTCGTGGMLSEAQNYLREHNAKAKLWVFGQDYNNRAYAMAASDLLMKDGQDSDIRFGDTLTNDQYPNERFNYFLANPPFGVDWKRQQKKVKEEHEKGGFLSRFGPGLPRVNDGAFLFLLHMVSKFEEHDPATKKFGSRLAIVFNGSPLFTGGAGSGESEIRRWLIEKQDYVEAIIAMPEQMFFNTGIGTYIWVLSNRKAPERRGKIQLIDARERWQAMRRSLGDKRRYLSEDEIATIVREYGHFTETETSKIFDTATFGYYRVPIERPLRLVYQMNEERKSEFLETYSTLRDDVQAIDKKLGSEPRSNWNEFDQLLNDLLKQRGSKWKQPQLKTFRDVFAERHAEAAPVIAAERKPSGDLEAAVWGWFLDQAAQCERRYEPDSQLRDVENVRLVTAPCHEEADMPNVEEVIRYFQSEVKPHIDDICWADGEKKQRAYEINFNRHFYKYKPPRPLAEIDADIKRMEEEIVRLLHEVTA